MARPKKKPGYDPQQMERELMEAVTEAYHHPPQDAMDEKGKMRLNRLTEEFAMTPLKIRKLLITTGAYQTETSRTVNALAAQGKTIAEIQSLTGLGRASVQSYLPYSRTVYKLEERTLLAERLQRYRSRKYAAERLQEVMALAFDLDGEGKETPMEGIPELLNASLWEAMIAFAGYPFRTAKALSFTYTVRGNEILFSRKEKSVTRATVNKTLETAVKLQINGVIITGGERLQGDAADFLYPVFVRLGVFYW